MYFPGLNTIRLYAALCVVVSHSMEGVTGWPRLGLEFFTLPGYDAVTLFFALSGFLITYQLLQEKRDTGDVAVKRFYYRRALRIWPLYFLVILASLILVPDQVQHDLTAWLAILLFSPHLVPGLQALGHYWSLGVEEWFYLAWAPLVKRYNVLAVAGAIVVVRLALPLLVPEMQGASSKYAYDTPLILFRWLRFDAMAAGAIAAWLFINRHWALRLVYRFQLGFIALAAATVALPFEGASWYDFVFSVIWSGLILNVATNPSPIIRLEWPGLRQLGALTYGVYMLQYLVIQMLTRTGLQPGAFIVATMATTLALAGASYHWIEAPILQLRNRPGLAHLAVMRLSRAVRRTAPEAAPLTSRIGQ